ncbi:MAG TPA: VWA domain-containing protein [Bryobacteraceae bacterium]
MRSIALLLCFGLALLAQQATFSTSTQLVIETVSVIDKSGRPVEGLTAKDFTITENGVRQQIRFFEEQKLPEKPQTAPAHSGPEHVQLYSRLTPTRIMPELPGVNQYRDHRLLAFYFDMTAMPLADQRRALQSALKFVRTQMTEADLVAIMRYSGGAVDVLQDFTGSRDRLLSILQTMFTGEMLGAGQGFTESGNDAGTPDAGFAFGQDDGEFNIFNTDRQLAALQTAAGMLGQLHEKKALIYFASGIRLNGMNNQAQLHATVNAAIRAGVSFWPIDARGLVAEPPMGDATKGSPGGADMYSGASAQATTTNLELSQDTLFALGSDTGGKALLDYNDLTKGLIDAQHATSTYYIIGYYTTQAARDGRFRRVKITLNGELSAKLDYRQGYYADKEFSRFTADDRERQLEDALMLPDPITELTIAMEIDYFQLNRAEYFVPIIVKIPGRELALAKRRGAEHTLIDFVGEIKDRYGITRTNVRDKINIKLSDETAVQLAKRPVEYDTGFTLLPGKYTIKFLARDDETGRIGTYQASFVIPNLNKVEKQVPVSSVILSGQRVKVSEALYNVAAKKINSENVNPLVENGVKLVPSVTRVFTKTRPVWVYLQAYEQGSQTVRPLVAFLTLYNGERKIFETPPVKATDARNDTVRTVPLKLEFNLAKLPPGKYDCQLTVLDPAEQKAAFWRTPIAIVP